MDELREAARVLAEEALHTANQIVSIGDLTVCGSAPGAPKSGRSRAARPQSDPDCNGHLGGRSRGSLTLPQRSRSFDATGYSYNAPTGRFGLGRSTGAQWRMSLQALATIVR
jgi:hypothetical protein